MKKNNFIIIFISLASLAIGYHIMDLINYRCFWKNNFNITCAGCGATRMVRALFNLDIYQAFRYNPLILILLFVVIIYFIYYLICFLIKKKPYIPGFKMIIFFVIILVIYTILRNIPCFEYLKPIKIK